MTTEGSSSLSGAFLGQSGIKVSNLCLGTLTFGESQSGRPGQCGEDLSHQIIKRFVECGGNFFDTADVYGLGAAENIVGKWLERQSREKFIIATKVRFNMGDNVANNVGLSRKHITSSVVQQYSLLHRESEFEPFQTSGLGVLPWSPLNDGLLTGKVKRGQIPTEGRLGWSVAITKAKAKSYLNDRTFDIIETAEVIGHKYGRSVAQVALRWLLQKEVVSSVIIGARTLEQLEDNLGAGSGWTLSQEE
ncbi:1-deoxyxylulose-5-phosphate synthase YajO isoform X2, partial [Biomphalaria glabrata]